MKEHPILVSGSLVPPILAGIKIETRRLLRVQPELPILWYPTPYNKKSLAYDGEAHFRRGVVADFAPWKVGDRLWVRETWAALGNDDGLPVNAKGEVVEWGPGVACVYRADTKPGKYGADILPDGSEWFGKWRPSIHMPRWASRISLEVTEVRVQRVQEITDEDADAEGTAPHCRCTEGCDICARSLVDYFRDTWDSLAPEGLKWTDNPWVWAVTFKLVQPPPPRIVV